MNEYKNTLKKLNKRYGGGTINEIADMGDINIERMPTGSYSLDYIMGGGIPRGRLMEIYGESSSGKTVLSLFMIRKVQEAGGRAAFLDVENSFSEDFAKKIGVDTKKLVLSKAVCAEDVLNIVEELTKTNDFDIIVVDSVASMVPKKELMGEIGDSHVALQARLMSQALRMITGSASKTKTSLVFLNQIRSKIGMYFGNKETTAGGRALKFYASIRIEVKKGKNILGKNDEAIGNWLRMAATKNKTAMPFRRTEFELLFEKGVDTLGDTLDFAVRSEVVTISGNTYSSSDGKKLAVGRNRTKKYLKANPDAFKKIEAELDNLLKKENDKPDKAKN